jgi:predicted flap endonuclease-1-like 5' DNA nuclease
MKTGNGRTPSLDAQLKALQSRMKKANQLAAKGIQENVRKFDAITNAAEKDLKRLKGVGKSALRTFKSELKRSWKDLKRIAQQQF